MDVGLPLAVAVALQQLYVHLQASLRARLRFNMASAQQLLIAVVFPVVTIAVIGVLGVSALVVAQAAAVGTAILFVRLSTRSPFKPRLDLATTRQLVRSGLPIMLAGLAFSGLTTMDRWLVAGLIGEDALGHYTLAVMLTGSIFLLSTIVSQQFYPRMAMQIGAGATGPAVFRIGLRQAAVAVTIMLPVIAVLFVAAAPVVGALFPGYGSSIPALRILLVGGLAVPPCAAMGNILVALGYSRRYLGLILGAAVLQFGSAIWLAGAGLGLAGIAAAAAASYVILAAALVLAARRVCRS
jgi:O-antigen/teichoic acid export membrane protein